MGRVAIKNKLQEKFNFLPYKESFDISLEPKDCITLDTLTDEEKLYYEEVAKDFVITLPGTMFETHFSSGNNGLFGSYGTVEDGPFGTILLNTDSSNIGPMTYFKRNDKNIPFGKNGIKVRVGLAIDVGQLNLDEYFNINIGINDIKKNGVYNLKTEKCIYFRKYYDTVRVGYEDGKSDNKTNETATLNNDSVVLPEDDYIIEFDISEINNEAILTIRIFNSQNAQVFRVSNIKFDINKIGLKDLGGVRYVWLSNSTAPWVELTCLSIIEK